MNNNKYFEWLQNTPLFCVENEKISLTEISIKSFVKSLKNKLEAEKCDILLSEKELEDLLFSVFLKEASETKGIVGDYAISLSKNNVFGLVLLIVGIIDTSISGFSLQSGILTSAGITQTILSTISKLSKEELNLVSSISFLKHELGFNPNVNTILDHKMGFELDNILKLLHSLVTKDALSWNGKLESEIVVKRWI